MSITKVALKCCIIKDSKILVLKKTLEEGKNDYGKNLYDLPGGRLEYGEDLIEGLKREVLEETGLNISDIKIIDGTSIINKEKINLVILQYTAKYCSGEILLSEEHDSYEWTETNKNKYPTWIKKNIKKILNKENR